MYLMCIVYRSFQTSTRPTFAMYIGDAAVGEVILRGAS